MRNTMRSTLTALPIVLFLAVGLAPAVQAEAQQNRTEVEERAERERRGAGLRVGPWLGLELNEPENADISTWPQFEGWFQRGLDRHLAIESTISMWRRVQEQGNERVSTFVVPLFTSLKFYPGTGPDASVQPHVLAGGGLGLGVDDREGTSGGLLGLGGNDGTRLYTGFGFRAGGGVDFRLSQAMGLTVGGRYQWIRFDGEPGGNRTFKGTVVDLGFTYRFQYE